MININRILSDNRLIRATTGLSIIGFESICEKFEKEFYSNRLKKYQKGVKKGIRQRKPGGGRSGQLNNIKLKTFFILIYFKCYPTMDLTGLIFAINICSKFNSVIYSSVLKTFETFCYTCFIITIN